MRIETIDSHTAGNPTRVIVGGVETPPGATLRERIEYLQREQDALRRVLNHEPRGGGLMCSVLLMPPIGEDADFSVIIMEQEGYVPMCGHCVIGTATTVVAEKMVPVRAPTTVVRFETPAGTVHTEVSVDADGAPTSVALTNVESFVLRRDLRLSVEGLGDLEIDILYGGDFYPVVDADSIGLQLEITNQAQIISAARHVREAVQADVEVTHPEIPEIDRCYQVMFVSREQAEGADVRATVVAPPGAVDRSPCGTGTSALVARAFSRGELGLGESITVQGPCGTSFVGTAVSAQTRGTIEYVTPTVEGSAHITGYHTFVLSKDDPFPAGFPTV